MKQNVGGIDRALRIIAGIVLILLSATGIIGWWGYLGILPALSGLAGFCALYPILGFSSCPLKPKDR